MLKAEAKKEYWKIVEACLVDFNRLSRGSARRRVAEAFKAVESPEVTGSSEIFYHLEPFYVACEMTDKELSLDEYKEKYHAILEQHDW